jgi:hypothetical protein
MSLPAHLIDGLERLQYAKTHLTSTKGPILARRSIHVPMRDEAAEQSISVVFVTYTLTKNILLRTDPSGNTEIQMINPFFFSTTADRRSQKGIR